MSRLRDIFLGEGAVKRVDGASPFSLSIPDTVWLVIGGVVDVFAVGTESDASFGARDHFFSIPAGQGAFGLHATSDNAALCPGISFLAVGRPGTKVASLPLERFRNLVQGDDVQHEACSDELAAFIDNFLVALASGLTKDIKPSPQGQRLLPEKGDVVLEKDEYAGAHKAPVWVRSNAPLLYLGMEHLAPGPAVLPFPVTGQAWVQALEDGRVVCSPTRALLDSGELWPALGAYHDVLFACLFLNTRFAAVDAYNVMLARMQSDERALESGLRKLVAIFTPKKHKPLSEEARESPLIAACELAAGTLGIPIVVPRLIGGRTSSAKLRVEDVAASSRIRIRKVVLSENWWRRDAGPMVGFTKDGKHPLALLPLNGSAYAVHDPTKHVPLPVTRGIAEGISEQAYCLYSYLPERPISGKEFLRFALRGCGADLRLLFFMGLVAGVLGMVGPLVLAAVFDNVIPYADRGRLMQLAGLLLASGIGVTGFEFVRNLATLRLTTRIHAQLEASIMDRILRMPLPFFRHQTAGDLAERIMGFTRIREDMAGALVSSLLSGFFGVSSLALLYYYHATLAWWVTCGLALYLAAVWLSWKAQLRFRRKIAAFEGQLAGKVLQYITGIPKLRAAGGEGRAFANWARSYAKQKQIFYRAGLIGKSMITVNNVYPVLISMGVFMGVTHFSGGGHMDTGAFVAFYAAFGNVLLSLQFIITPLAQLSKSWPYAERVKPILGEAPEITPERVDPGELSGRIEIQGLSFRYATDAPLVLKNISLSIHPGEFLALAGPSGSGKTTLLRLLLGFETPTAGSIYYDDMDLFDLDLGKVRRNMGVVIQNSSVMPGTILSNIVGTRQLSLRDAWEAARMVGLEDDIKAMPMGMFTLVNEGGSTLSGGQRQRLIIARALVNRPRILLLDEATSALDNHNQSLVSKSLELVKATRIVVAHRLSTIRNADRIVVINKGEVVESGGHDELLEKGGLYKLLVQRQML